LFAEKVSSVFHFPLITHLVFPLPTNDNKPLQFTRPITPINCLPARNLLREQTFSGRDVKAVAFFVWAIPC
jgi:hypothetical protein